MPSARQISNAAVATPPPNDLCANATTITAGTLNIGGAGASGAEDEHRSGGRDEEIRYAKLLTHKASSGGGGAC